MIILQLLNYISIAYSTILNRTNSRKACQYANTTPSFAANERFIAKSISCLTTFETTDLTVNDKDLILENNAIKDFQPSVFNKIKAEVEHIDLHLNYLTIIDRHFQNLSALEILDLSKNQITVVRQNAFIGCLKLEHLHLQNNQIGCTDKNFGWNSLTNDKLTILLTGNPTSLYLRGTFGPHLYFDFLIIGRSSQKPATCHEVWKVVNSSTLRYPSHEYNCTCIRRSGKEVYTCDECYAPDESTLSAATSTLSAETHYQQRHIISRDTLSAETSTLSAETSTVQVSKWISEEQKGTRMTRRNEHDLTTLPITTRTTNKRVFETPPPPPGGRYIGRIVGGICIAMVVFGSAFSYWFLKIRVPKQPNSSVIQSSTGQYYTVKFQSRVTKKHQETSFGR